VLPCARISHFQGSRRKLVNREFTVKFSQSQSCTELLTPQKWMSYCEFHGRALKYCETQYFAWRQTAVLSFEIIRARRRGREGACSRN
jgi:hypothetical protein